MTTTLVAIPYSPWSEKARWALDHHRVRYREVEHVPMLGEPLLRLRARRPFGRASAPTLVDDGHVVIDSFEIARYVDEGRCSGDPGAGRASSLFPDGMVDRIRAWNERAEVISSAGRARVVRRTLESEDTLRESIPAFVPGAIRGAMLPVARLGARFLVRKYSIDPSAEAHQDALIRAELVGLREALAPDRAHLVGEGFTFADVAMATALHWVKPVSDEWIRLAPATRETWTHHALAREFGDLLEWRDATYRRDRRLQG